MAARGGVRHSNGEHKFFLAGVTPPADLDETGSTCSDEENDDKFHNEPTGGAGGSQLLPHPDELFRDGQRQGRIRRIFRSTSPPRGHLNPTAQRHDQMEDDDDDDDDDSDSVFVTEAERKQGNVWIMISVVAAGLSLLCLGVGLRLSIDTDVDADGSGNGNGNSNGKRGEWGRGTNAPTAGPVATRLIPVVPRDSHWKQMGKDLLGQHPNAAFGYSVALDTTGMRLAVGSPFTHDALGALGLVVAVESTTGLKGWVKVYDWDSTTQMWIASGNELLQEKGPHFGAGHSLSMSMDGQRVGVTSYTHQGSAFTIYQQEDVSFHQQEVPHLWLPIHVVTTGDEPHTATATTTPTPKQQFVLSSGGHHYAMSGNGQAKPTRVLQQETNSWEQVGLGIYSNNDVLNSTVVAHGGRRHVALSHTGHRVAVSLLDCHSNQTTTTTATASGGVISVYSIKSSHQDWVPLGESLRGLDNLCQPFSPSPGMALSGNGKILAAVSFHVESAETYVKAFHYHADEWIPWGNPILIRTEPTDEGLVLSLSHDGHRLAVGTLQLRRTASDNGHKYMHRGVVQVYQYGRSSQDEVDANANWHLLASRILGKSVGDMVGWSVALSADGNRLAMGAPYNQFVQQQDGNGTAGGNNNAVISRQGHVRVYQLVEE